MAVGSQVMKQGRFLMLLAVFPALLQAATGGYTVTGAEVNGNANGSIPPWQSNVGSAPQGWTPEAGRARHDPNRDEKPLYIISQANVDKFAHSLPPGAIHLLRKKPGYTMPVYPTHRSCSVPEFVADNTVRNKGKARIASDGWSIEDAILPSIPFPQPRNGIEAIWNHLLLYQGVAIEAKNSLVYVSPYSEGTEPIIVDAAIRFYYPWAVSGEHKLQSGDIKQGLSISARLPAALSGQITMQRIYFDRSPESFYFHPGQRRIRRLPSYAYDAPILGLERIYPVDAMGVFNGNPDKFDWTLKGKRELLVPYNAFNLTGKDAQGRSIFGRHFVAPDVRRYELHRVWVLEGNLRAGMRHSTSKKVLYLDEDSWAAVAGEDYDVDGRLVRYKEAAAVPIWEINACVTQFSMILYDFVQDRYLRDGYSNEENDLRFYPAASAPWMRTEEFSEAALRRLAGY